VITLGCEKNTVDSEVIGGMLSRRGVQLEPNAARASTIIINTCGFIDHAKKESIGAILEAIELKQSASSVVREVFVAGCLSERYRSELQSEMPEVDRFFGTQDFEQILSAVIPESTIDLKYNLLGERTRFIAHDEFIADELGENSSSSPTMNSSPAMKPYAYLKISEGCDHPCSFCAIPIMRGGHRSRGIEELEFEAMMLGAKELVLIAQDSTNYGLDLYGERSIAKLLTRLARIPSIEWIRLMYAYPAKFPLDLLDVMAGEEKIVPYLDIPVQHASTAVLKSMRRGITRRATEDLISKIRERVPGIALRTTLITGYPAEGEREFEELEEFVEQMQFDRLGVFTYSQEDGTTAHPLGDPVTPEEKLLRQARLYDIQAEISLTKNLAKVGSFDKVLIERKAIDDDAEYYYGRTSSHAPEVDGEVRVSSQRELAIGDFAHVRITSANDYELQAEIAIPSSPMVNSSPTMKETKTL
jgi:ribosomal protein S12 methylthiotransferase